MRGVTHMDYSFIIRKAETKDAQSIKAIIDGAFRKYREDVGITTPLDALQETLSDIEKDILSIDVFIAFIDNVPVGTIRVRMQDDRTAYISRFGVMPGCHNIGIGKALMNLVDKLLLSRDVKKTYLHTASAYKDLVRFYYERGYYIESTSTDRGYVRALMVKEYLKT